MCTIIDRLEIPCLAVSDFAFGNFFAFGGVFVRCAGFGEGWERHG